MPRGARWTWFVPVTAYYLYVDYIGPAVLSMLGPRFDRWAAGPARFQELTELILAFGFAFFVYDALRLSKPRGSGATDGALVSTDRTSLVEGNSAENPPPLGDG